jgi:ABC-type transport system substrate-binding protein
MRKKITKLSLFALVGMLIAALYIQVAQPQTTDKYFFEITIMLDAANIDAVEIMKNGWEQIGVKVNVVSMEFSSMFSKYMFRESFAGATYDEGGYDICLTGGVYAEDPDSFSAYHSDSRLGVGRFPNYNMMMFTNGDVDRLLEDGLQSVDRDERIPIYRQIEEIIHEEVPVIYLYRDPAIKGTTANLDLGPWRVFPGSALYQYAYDFEFTDQEGGEMVFIGDQNPPGLNAAYSITTVGVNNAFLVQQTLARTTLPFGTYQPVLAESWDVSDDKKTYTFHLREGVTWHDGETFDAEDVKFTFDIYMNPDAGASGHGLWAANVKEVRMVDQYTIELETNEVFAPAIYRFARRIILPEHILGDVSPGELRGHEFMKKPIGTGPFKVIEWVDDEYIQYEAYADYWEGPPALDSILFRVIPDKATGIAALEAGEVHLIEQQIYRTALVQNYDRLKDDSDLTVTVDPPTGVNYLILNLEHPILNNKFVRKALAHAIDLDGIIEGPYAGLAVGFSQRYSQLLEGYYNPDLKSYEYDLDKAKEFMEMAGYDYALLEEPETPEVTQQTDYVAIAGGLIVGLIVGFAVDRFVVSRD